VLPVKSSLGFLKVGLTSPTTFLDGGIKLFPLQKVVVSHYSFFLFCQGIFIVIYIFSDFLPQKIVWSSEIFFKFWGSWFDQRTAKRSVNISLISNHYKCIKSHSNLQIYAQKHTYFKLVRQRELHLIKFWLLSIVMPMVMLTKDRRNLKLPLKRMKNATSKMAGAWK
jgi:hypothetical protein